jgi:hypothetical protein
MPRKNLNKIAQKVYRLYAFERYSDEKSFNGIKSSDAANNKVCCIAIYAIFLFAKNFNTPLQRRRYFNT